MLLLPSWPVPVELLALNGGELTRVMLVLVVCWSGVVVGGGSSEVGELRSSDSRDLNPQGVGYWLVVGWIMSKLTLDDELRNVDVAVAA